MASAAAVDTRSTEISAEASMCDDDTDTAPSKYSTGTVATSYLHTLSMLVEQSAEEATAATLTLAGMASDQTA